MEIKDTYTETARRYWGYDKRRKKKPWISKEVFCRSVIEQQKKRDEENKDKQ